jgi:CO/xanthine dehydrogenase Mo-binding subunit
MTTIGKSEKRIDAHAKVTGKALYAGDIHYPDLAYAKVLFAGRPHAIIHNIDIYAAESLPGVIAVFTAKDVPVNEYGFTPDQPVLCGPGAEKPYTDRVRFIGDQVALVIADTAEIAAKARSLIRVEYEDLPVISDPLHAMQEDAYVLHPEIGSNIFGEYHIHQGNLEEGFQQADVIVESEYRTPSQEHAFMEPEAGVAYIDDKGRVTVEVAGQWAIEEQRQIAHALGLDQDQVRVIHPVVGGAFGGREDISIQIVLALAVWRLAQRGVHRPVKLVWTREESFLGHHKRHPFIIRTRWGANKDGLITAATVEMIADGGSYESTSNQVIRNALLNVTGPYVIPNVKVAGYVVYTNNIPSGAFRGFGGPQGCFASEIQIDKLAGKLGIDPVEMRLRNAASDDAIMPVGTALPPGVSIREVIKACASASNWRRSDRGWERSRINSINNQSASKIGNKSHIRTGVGFACAYKNVGFSFGWHEYCWAKIELHGDREVEHVVLHHLGTEIGQGAHTVFKQMTAEAAGVPLEKVELALADTAGKEDSGSASASRMTFMAGNAILGAVEEAFIKWQDEERPAISEYTYRAPKTSTLAPGSGKCYPNVSYGYVAEAVTLKVDTETGRIRILDVVCADDVGKAINPQQIEGQIEGCIVQGCGHMIQENFVLENGMIKTPSLSTYLIPTIMDIPDQIESIILEYPDPGGPWGARGVGEMPMSPLPAAIAIALQDATGVWFDEYPLTPERVLRGLGKI